MTALAGHGSAVPLFATPFAAVDTGANPRFNERLAKLCESQGDQQNFLDSADATAVELKHLILDQAATVVAGLNSIDAARFAKLQIEAQAWCSILPRNGHIPAQHFSNASWLAVYCVQAGHSESRSSGVLRLYERRLESVYRDASNSELLPPYRYGNHTWAPTPGCMALFPAHVPHEVSVVRSATSLILVFVKLRFLVASAEAGVNG